MLREPVSESWRKIHLHWSGQRFCKQTRRTQTPRGRNHLYDSLSPHKSRYTSNRRYAIRNHKRKKNGEKTKKRSARQSRRTKMEKEKEENREKIKTQGKTFMRHRHFVSRHRPRGHAHMRAHETRRGNAHVRSSIKVPRGRGCVCGHTSSELFQRGKLRGVTGDVTGDCARMGPLPRPGERGTGATGSGGGRIDGGTGEGEGDDARTAGHLLFTELPVHGLSCAPWNGHFFGYFRPHFGFESIKGRVSEF